ncbi:MAG TPA: type II toxin-antitoxin system PemK/MazF family toxin [Bryobacteraceae bacterium]|nr:type II toxin-antitoxin system PemK/MazF family toxin [Bryobacteraceae bacterium]
MGQTRTRRTGSKAYPQRGEIYVAALDPALGHEIKKTRPALIIQNDVSNQYSQTTIVAAITSRVNTQPYPNEVHIHALVGSGLNVPSTVRLDQLRTIDRQRLVKRLGKADAATMRGR